MKRKAYKNSLLIEKMVTEHTVTFRQILNIFAPYVIVCDEPHYTYEVERGDETTVEITDWVVFEFDLFKINSNHRKELKKRFRYLRLDEKYKIMSFSDMPRMYLDFYRSWSTRAELYHLLMDLKWLAPDYHYKLEMLLFNQM